MSQFSKYLLVSLTIFLFQINSFGQNRIVDSLKLALKNAKHDTTVVLTLVELTKVCDEKDILKYAEPCIDIANKNINSGDEHKRTYLKSLAIALSSVGYYNQMKGDIPKALECYFSCLKKYEELGYKKGIASALNNIGTIYNNQGDISKALEYYLKSLKINEEINDKKMVAYVLNNIGIIYISQNDIPKALEYYKKGLKIREEIGDQLGIAFSLNSLGATYFDLGDTSKALEYNHKSLKIRQESGDKRGIAISLSNLGDIYNSQGNINKALECNQECLRIGEQIEDKMIIAETLNNIAGLIVKKGNLQEALIYANKGMEMSKELGYPKNIYQSANTLKSIFQKQNKYKEAFEMYGLEMRMKDSINNEETQNAAVKKQMQYVFEKKEQEAKVEQEKKDVIANEEKKTQQIITYSISVGFIIVLIFGLFILRGLKQKQKANLIITQQKIEVENQKHLVEQKHKEITDSINYAERIQRSLLASKKILDENLRDHFILFKPKDVVSGDFYWASKLKNGHFALVTADSTGHGVPGAIMSIVNMASLKEAVIQGITSPDLILNETRRLVIENLKNDGSTSGGKDGMDGSLLSFDFANKILFCSSANNPIWIVRNKEISEIKYDRMPIGKHDKDQLPFNLHTINIEKGDVIYALTDGYPDQFGGENGRKFKTKQLQEIIVSIAHESMEVQKQMLNDMFDHWKGDLEQVDDVTVIGIRV